jgi:hypothetical protein
MNFLDKLTNKKIPNQNTKAVELWDVEGIIEGVSNQTFKFDLRPLKNNAKGGSFKTKADKIVYDIKDQYIIIDVEELHQHLNDKSLKVLQLEDLISELEWNIILPK